MSLVSRKSFLERIRRGRAARAKLVANNLSEGIAFQIRATRDAQKLTQTDLAREVGMTQNNFSRLESPEYGKHTISSLKRIAEALDVALVVRFVPFSQYIDWLSGTRHLDHGLNPESMAVPSFESEERKDAFNIERKYFEAVVAAPVQKQPANYFRPPQEDSVVLPTVHNFPPMGYHQAQNERGQVA